MPEEQAKPLAPAARRVSGDEEEPLSTERKRLRRRRCIKCCGCVTASILILVVTIVVLVFTVFRVKDPDINMNSVSLEGLEIENRNFRTTVNMTLVVDVSVKNPNVASFKFNNATTSISYGGVVVGEVQTPAGQAKARRTLRMNATVEVLPDRIMGVPSLIGDLTRGELTMNTFTRIAGKVKIIQIIKKHVVVRMNCTVNINISSRTIGLQGCRRRVSL